MNLLLIGMLAAFASPAADTTRVSAAQHGVATGAAANPERLPIRVEARLGGSIGVVRAAEADDRLPGPAWHIGASYPVAHFAEVTGGYGHHSFRCESGFCQDRDVHFTGRGVDVGVRLHTAHLWAATGVIFHALDSRWTTDLGAHAHGAPGALGWHAGAGLAVPVTDRFRVVPGVRYANYQASFDGAPGAGVGYLTVDIGVSVRVR
jgi:hypothetical protein